MGRLQRIENFVNRIAPEHINLLLVPRGLPLFVDKLLSGVVRFARRYGSSLSVLAPEVEMHLANAISTNASSLVVKTLVPWMDIGLLLSIDDRDRIAVTDYDTATSQIYFDDQLLTSYIENKSVYLYAFPIEMLLDHAKGEVELSIKSKYLLAPGDVFALEIVSGQLLSIREISVLSTELQSSTLAGTMPYAYKLQLEFGLPKDLAQDSIAYIRAYPAYFSREISIPLSALENSYGPILVDNLSGRYLEGDQIAEYLSLRIRDTASNVIYGTENSTAMISKNFPIQKVDLPYDLITLMSRVYGYVRFDSNHTYAITDDQGRWQFKTEVIPELPPGYLWKVDVLPESVTYVRIQFQPNEYTEYLLLPGTVTTILLGTIPLDDMVNRIVITLKATDPKSKIRFGRFFPTTWYSEDYFVVIPPSISSVTSTIISVPASVIGIISGLTL